MNFNVSVPRPSRLHLVGVGALDENVLDPEGRVLDTLDESVLDPEGRVLDPLEESVLDPEGRVLGDIDGRVLSTPKGGY